MALGFDRQIVISPHIGDLETPMALDGAEQVTREFPQYFKQLPDAVIVDLHPDMQSSRLGKKYAAEHELNIFKIQHHHAHAAAVMAEFNLTESLALVFDGTGLGGDGKIWGAELLHVVPGDCRRLGTFKDVPLPGGDAAVRRPARQLIARWLDAGVTVNSDWLSILKVTAQEFNAWSVQCRRHINAVSTHAAGRVFDAWSALLGVAPHQVTYEGQAAVWMETVAKDIAAASQEEIMFDTVLQDDLLFVDFARAFARFASDPPKADMIPALAKGFHSSIIRAGLKMAQHGREVSGCSTVVLAGGVMINKIIANGLVDLLKNNGFIVLLPRLVPVNDGGISPGQIYAIGGNL